jgi:AraC family transcriptional activator of pobA
LDLLLLELHGHVQERSRSRHESERADPLSAEVLAFIDRAYQRPLSLAEVARHFALSPSHLTRRVRDTTGKTVQQWIIARRLAGARSLLRDTDAPVEAIARDVGYVDTAHFGRHFRREHGCAPGVWRKSIKQQ